MFQVQWDPACYTSHRHRGPASLCKISPSQSWEAPNFQERVQWDARSWYHSSIKEQLVLTLTHCFQIRCLNSMTTNDHYPIPNMLDFAAVLEGKTDFSKMDLIRGFHHIPLNEEDIPKTALINPFGLLSSSLCHLVRKPHHSPFNTSWMSFKASTLSLFKWTTFPSQAHLQRNKSAMSTLSSNTLLNMDSPFVPVRYIYLDFNCFNWQLVIFLNSWPYLAVSLQLNLSQAKIRLFFNNSCFPTYPQKISGLAFC